ncbi:MAG: hypothetical protein QM775_22580 [Pirellulales bacterium]
MSTLLANVGLPMLFWQMPVATIVFFPIVLVESLIALRIFKQRFVPIFLRMSAANALSTFVGVPVAWIGMLMVNFATAGGRWDGYSTPLKAFKSVVLQASWLAPHEEQMIWLVPAATLVLLVPYFLASVFIERWLLRQLFPDLETGRVSRAAWIANVVSYGGLAAYTAFWLFRGLARVNLTT